VTARTLLGQLVKCRSAVAALEFALIGSTLVGMTLASIEAGLILWTRTALQSTAALVARCATVGAGVSSSSCNTTDNAKSYAVTTMQNYVPISGVITTADVTITSVTTCPAKGASGNFTMVTITSSYWSSLPTAVPWLSAWNSTLSATACYPT